MTFDQDAFDDWKANPITEAVFMCCEAWAQQAKSHWITASWEGGAAEPIFLARMRERAAAFEELTRLSPEIIEETLS